MAGKPGIARISVEKAKPLSHQDRINMEMFKAIEALGRRIERTEHERHHISRRLLQIESSATVDEKTGKLYLPVVAGNSNLPQVIQRAPKWQGFATVMSSALALLAVGLVLFREPVPAQHLNAQQLAALDSLVHARFAKLEDNRWQPIDEETARDVAVQKIDIRKFVAEQPEEAPAPAVTELAAAPTPEELSAIEPAAGEAPVDTEAQVEEQPVAAAEEAVAPPAPVKQAEKPVPAKPEKKLLAKKSAPPLVEETNPLQRPADDYAPIPLAAKKAAPVTVAEKTSEEKPVVRKSTAETIVADPAALAMAGSADELPAKKAAPVLAAAPKPAAPASKPAVTGVEPDAYLPPKLAELEKRAFAGTPEAQHDLATIYAAGKVVAQDYKRAAFWFSKAADKGIANAHYNLGVMFQQGLGVRQDVNKALGWYEKAAQLGHPEAMYNLGIAYIEGIGTTRNIQRGVSFFKQAANAGVAQAAYNLGILYESNFIGPIDLAKAADWYQVASNGGHSEAKQALARLKEGMGDITYGADVANDTGLTLAKNIEPATGSEEGYGEGDESPLDNDGRANPPGFGDELVRKIQEALITRGELPPNTTTGYMTPQTEDAIRTWQKSLGWEANGKPSRELLEKLSPAK